MTPNTDRHEKTSSSAPDTTTPSTAAPPATPAQMLTALTRWAGGKVPVIVDSVAGMTSAAPRPMTARSPISTVASEAIIAAAEPMPNTARPMISSRRRP